MNNEKKEKLAAEVQKWQLLYDKSDKHHLPRPDPPTLCFWWQNRVLVDQAWAKVVNMGIEGSFLQHDGEGPTSTTCPEKTPIKNIN